MPCEPAPQASLSTKVEKIAHFLSLFLVSTTRIYGLLSVEVPPERETV